MLIFWEITSGYIVFNASYVVVGIVSENSAMFVPQWYMLCVSHGVSCWLRCTSRCVPLWFSGPDALHHERFGPEDCYAASQLQLFMVERFPYCWTK